MTQGTHTGALTQRVGGGGGRETQERRGHNVCQWLIHADVWQKATQYCNDPSIKNKYILKNTKTPKTHQDFPGDQCFRMSFNAGDAGSIPVGELRFLMPRATKPVLHSTGKGTPQLESLSPQ